ncbi:hypothetical protein SM007_28735 [Streptomyces avermitilis]|nr:hypothetical protein SM007_28735 [Streptomyces avermitilis]
MVAPESATLSGSRPRWNRPEPLRPRTPPPNLPARAPAARRLHREATHHCTAERRPLNTAGHPVRSSVPSPSCKSPGFGTPPPHRPANCGTTAWQFISAGLALPWLREKP